MYLGLAEVTMCLVNEFEVEFEYAYLILIIEDYRLPFDGGRGRKAVEEFLDLFPARLSADQRLKSSYSSNHVLRVVFLPRPLVVTRLPKLF